MNVYLANARLDPVDTGGALCRKPAVTVAFPPCTDELLALIRKADADEITRSFRDYFKRRGHRIFGEEFIPGADTRPDEFKNFDGRLKEAVDDEVLKCPSPGTQALAQWPKDCCVCNPCVTLDGIRNLPEPP